jgi:hypothetical protein
MQHLLAGPRVRINVQEQNPAPLAASATKPTGIKWRYAVRDAALSSSDAALSSSDQLVAATCDRSLVT